MSIRENLRNRAFERSKDVPTAFEIGFPLRAQMFAIANSNWNEYFNPERLKELLKDPYENFNAIKDVRRAGLMLRSAHHLFTEKPIPEAANEIIRTIGVHNDWMNIGNEPHCEPVLQAVSAFVPTEQEPTLVNDLAYRQRVIDNAKKISDRASYELVSADAFHDMRRYLKHFLGLYRMLELAEGGEPNSIHARFDAMNTRLGGMRDDNLQINNGVVVSINPLMEIDGALREEIFRIVNKVVPK